MASTNLRSLYVVLALTGAATNATHLRGQVDGGALNRATVHIMAFDPFGSRIGQVRVHLLSVDRKSDLAQPGHPEVVYGVPYGYYIVSATDTGGGIAEREITVNTQEVWVRIGLSFPSGDRASPPGNLSITGYIQPAPRGANWWARVEGVFLNVRREAPVLGGGWFRIEGLEMGTYLVEVFDGSKLRHTETVEIDPREPERQLKIPIPLGSERATPPTPTRAISPPSPIPPATGSSTPTTPSATW
jgi:hypothetical protein